MKNFSRIQFMQIDFCNWDNLLLFLCSWFNIPVGSFARWCNVMPCEWKTLYCYIARTEEKVLIVQSFSQKIEHLFFLWKSEKSHSSFKQNVAKFRKYFYWRVKLYEIEQSKVDEKFYGRKMLRPRNLISMDVMTKA